MARGTGEKGRHLRNDGGSVQSSCDTCGEKQLESRYILKVKPRKFSDGLV